jgi:hypothetical protein
MPAISFSSDAFRIKILEGKKRQTIRNPRKNPIKAGDSLHLFYKQRTSECMKLGIASCLSVTDIEIHECCLYIGGLAVCTEQRMHEFAVADGFQDWEGLIQWFKVSEGKPFKGVLIKWEYPFPVTPESSDFEYQMAWNEALAAKKAKEVA